MKRWQALIPEADKDTMARAQAKVDEFIAFRKELVRLSREATLAQAREFGDNDANHNNRKALNAEIAKLAEHNDRLIADVTKATNDFFDGRLTTLIVIAVLGVLIGFAIAVAFVTRVITGPIARSPRP